MKEQTHSREGQGPQARHDCGLVTWLCPLLLTWGRGSRQGFEVTAPLRGSLELGLPLPQFAGWLLVPGPLVLRPHPHPSTQRHFLGSSAGLAPGVAPPQVLLPLFDFPLPAPEPPPAPQTHTLPLLH